MDKAKEAIKNYIFKASDLAESVKRNIQHNQVIDDETVIKLRDFIVASNELADLEEDIMPDMNENDKDLN